VRSVLDVLNTGFPGHEWIRASVTDDFTHEDHGPLHFPNADADTWGQQIESLWLTGADGQLRTGCRTVAVRGERFAALAVTVDFGNGMISEWAVVAGLDPTLALLQRSVFFDIDDVDGAILALDRLHKQAEEN
jgi:hypothetical protein